MKFLIDAQLPRRLARELSASGHDLVHTLDLLAGNRTSDEELSEIAIREERVVVSKDSDFVASFLLRRVPSRLLLISTGNISNEELSRLIAKHLARVETAFTQHAFVELNRAALLIHD